MIDNLTGEMDSYVDRREFVACGAGALFTGHSGIVAALEQQSVPAMLKPAPAAGFTAHVLLSAGDDIGGYRPPGIMDGTAAWDSGDHVRVYVNHELGPAAGYPWKLANGLQLTGSRISYVEIDKRTRTVIAAGDAIRQIFDRRGEVVRDARQINEHWGRASAGGLHTLCSAQGYRAGELGFVDDLMFTHEEVSAQEDHPHGGSVWALDVSRGDLWALPELGRGSWENVTAVATPDMHAADGQVALLLSDDLEFGAAPLYLWVGSKQPGGDLPARNGLSKGQLYVWVAAEGYRSPEDWHGTGATAAGSFVPVQTRDASQLGRSGHDRDGYLDDTVMRERARRLGAFMFSRPEDLHTNPANLSQVVLASAGHGKVFPSDDWGTLYLIDITVHAEGADATLRILHDADDFGDYGIRSADNVVWASDGMIYVQEDKATKIRPFGSQTGRDASIWCIDPADPDDYRVIAVVDRSAVWPPDARDRRASELGAWESSGILDVSAQFGTGDELVLLATVQAHSVRGGSLGGMNDLVQGAQLLLLSKPVAND